MNILNEMTFYCKKTDKFEKRLTDSEYKYLNKTDGNLDIITLFRAYLEKVQNFFDWYKEKRKEEYKEIIQPYEIVIKNMIDFFEKNNRKIDKKYL